MIHRGDARAMTMIDDGSVDCVVGSPPYPMQRVYGEDPAEIGQGATLDVYLEEMVECGKEQRRVLRPDGTAWWVIGDKANGSGGAGGDYNRGGKMEGKPRFGRFRDPDYKVTQFLGVSRKVEEALQRDGWRVRMAIVWDKGGVGEVQDEGHVRRPVLTHEFILMLAPTKKRTRYFSEHADWIERGSVWNIGPGSDGPKHLAPFPIQIPRRCILLSTLPGETVLDPWAGSGTTLRAAEQLDRVGIGVDLYADENPVP